jgi:hypothetical protein
MLKNVRNALREMQPYLLIILLGCVTAALVPHPKQRQTETGYKAPEQYPLETWAAMMAAVFTGWIGGYAVLQYGESRKSSERQLRAYCFVEKASISGVDVGEVPVATIRLKNFGQTPARDFLHWARVTYAPFPLQAPLRPLDMTVRRPRPLPPSGDTGAHPRLNVALTAPEIEALAEGVSAIYIMGEMQYLDAFGTQRWTKFHLFTGGPLGLSGQVAQHEEGNDYF